MTSNTIAARLAMASGDMLRRAYTTTRALDGE